MTRIFAIKIANIQFLISQRYQMEQGFRLSRNHLNFVHCFIASVWDVSITCLLWEIMFKIESDCFNCINKDTHGPKSVLKSSGF